MTFYTTNRKRQGIPIVPMLDILTILLIFFIVHTQLKTQQHVLKIDLPQTHHLAGDIAPKNEVLLEIDGEGSMALGGKRLASDGLEDALRDLLRRQPDARVQVSAAEGAPMGSLVRVMDILTAAGIDTPQVPVRIDFQPAS